MSDIFAPILAALSRYQFIQHDERELQEAIAHVLGEAGIEFERERSLDKHNRVDFYILATRLVIEVKVQGSPMPVLRQLWRYGKHPDTAGILLVTTLAKLARIPDSIAEKPARAFRIAGGFG